MIFFHLTNRSPLTVALGGILFVLIFFTTAQVNYASNEMTTDKNIMLVSGKIRLISIETMSLAVRPNKGKRIQIMFTDETQLENFNSYEKLNKNDQVKIWYSKEGERNRAIKILKVIDVCPD